MRSPSLFSLVIPVYNDAAALTHMLPEVYNTLTNLKIPFEIIVVDDGSKDNINECVQTFVTHYETVNLKLIHLSRNFGKEAALSAGLAEARGDTVVFMDGDGQHPASLIEPMLNLWRSGVDMVAGVQTERPHETFLLKKLKAAFYLLIQEGERFSMPKNAGDFRLMDRKVVDALLGLPERRRFMKGLYAWVGFHVVLLPFEAKERLEGTSKFKLPQLFELGITAITSFSLKPLRWISRIGIIISLLVFFYGIFIVGNTIFFGIDLPGWATLAAGIMLFSGLQLICLGVIGEYLGRVFEEVKQRPLYIVDKVLHTKQLQRHPPEETGS